MTKHDQKIEAANEAMMATTDGLFMVMPTPPAALFRTIPASLWHYWGMTKGMQRNFQRASIIQGRYGMFVFQSSHGRQQIKLYQPWIYKNEVNTPLRIRARKIMQLSSQEPKEIRQAKVKELYRSYPYHLLKSEPVKLRMKNFYFDRQVNKGDLIRIYRAVDPQNTNPHTDPLYQEKEYGEKRVIGFDYQQTEQQHYYAVNARNNARSNVLQFIWQDEINFETKTENVDNEKFTAANIFTKGLSLNKMIEEVHKSIEERVDLMFIDNHNQTAIDAIKPALESYLSNLNHFYNYYKIMQSKHEKLKKSGYLDDSL